MLQDAWEGHFWSNIFGKDLFELIYFKTFQNTYQSTADDTTKFPVVIYTNW